MSVTGGTMLDPRAKVLLIVPADALDRARVVAGKATIALKLPVSLQIVLRALIEEGLKREGYPGLIANIENQAKAMRLRRSMARRDRSEDKGRRRRER